MSNFHIVKCGMEMIEIPPVENLNISFLDIFVSLLNKNYSVNLRVPFVLLQCADNSEYNQA